jgi:hypothetical protein
VKQLKKGKAYVTITAMQDQGNRDKKQGFALLEIYKKEVSLLTCTSRVPITFCLQELEISNGTKALHASSNPPALM